MSASQPNDHFMPNEHRIFAYPFDASKPAFPPPPPPPNRRRNYYPIMPFTQSTTPAYEESYESVEIRIQTAITSLVKRGDDNPNIAAAAREFSLPMQRLRSSSFAFHHTQAIYFNRLTLWCSNPISTTIRKLWKLQHGPDAWISTR